MREFESKGPLRLVACIRDTTSKSPILFAEGEWVELLERLEVNDVEDLNIPKPTYTGIHVFEGWHTVAPHDFTDVAFEGNWRLIDHWEMCRIRYGNNPFRDRSEETSK